MDGTGARPRKRENTVWLALEDQHVRWLKRTYVDVSRLLVARVVLLVNHCCVCQACCGGARSVESLQIAARVILMPPLPALVLASQRWVSVMCAGMSMRGQGCRWIRPWLVSVG